MFCVSGNIVQAAEPDVMFRPAFADSQILWTAVFVEPGTESRWPRKATVYSTKSNFEFRPSIDTDTHCCYHLPMTKKLIKHGNSLALILDKETLAAMGVTKNLAVVSLITVEDGLLIRAAKKKERRKENPKKKGNSLMQFAGIWKETDEDEKILADLRRSRQEVKDVSC